MSLVIVKQGETPPGGWNYTQSDTGFRMSHNTLSGLKALIESHRRANSLDIGPGWWEQVVLEMCAEQPAITPRCREQGPTEPKPLTLTVIAALRFFRTMREWATKHRLAKVEQTEADRRASICAGCPKNTVAIKGCPGCEGVTRWLKEFLAKDQHTPHDDAIHYCGVCRCALKLKVWLPGDAVRATRDQPLDAFPEICWVRELGDMGNQEN